MKNSKLDHHHDESDGDEDERVDGRVAQAQRIEGEEEDGHEKFNDDGVAIEPFNMKNEREGGGRIDGNMNYVFEKEEADPDGWVAGLDETTEEQAIGEAARASAKRRVESRKAAMQFSRRERRTPPVIKRNIVEMLSPGESIAMALKRLSADAKVKTSGSSARVRNSSAVDELTELVSEAMEAGEALSYSLTREELEHTFVQWEYRALDGSLQGPFPTATMRQWLEAGFFDGDRAVQLRKVYPTARNNDDDEADAAAIAALTEPQAKKARLEDLANDFDDSDDNEDNGSDEKNEQTQEKSAKQQRNADVGPWLSSSEIDLS